MVETKTIQHNAIKIGEILPSSLTEEVKKAKRLEREKCKQCGREYNPRQALMGVCPVCQRKMLFEVLPVGQQELQIIEVVRERYKTARLDDLSNELKAILLSETDGVYLWGKAGVGKTYAMAALVRHYIPQGYDVKRISYEKLCLLLRDTFKQNSVKSEWQVIEPYLKCGKLFLEDISTTVSVGRQESDFSLRVVLLILDQRSEDCLPTYITGNKPISELQNAFDSRIASRLRQSKVIKLTGKDRREKILREKGGG